MKLSFVFPIYNEIENLPRLLPAARRIAEGIADEYEVLLVDDGSDDGSGPYADRLASGHSHVRASTMRAIEVLAPRSGQA